MSLIAVRLPAHAGLRVGPLLSAAVPRVSEHDTLFTVQQAVGHNDVVDVTGRPSHCVH